MRMKRSGSFSPNSLAAYGCGIMLIGLIAYIATGSKERDIHEVDMSNIPTPSFIAFEENKGQHEDGVAYRLRMHAAQLDFHRDHLHMVMAHPGDLEHRSHRHIHHGHDHDEPKPIRYHGIQTSFLGSQTRSIEVDGLRHGTRNYFIGSDPSEWASDVKVYSSLMYRDLYQNIDLKYYEANGHLKYDFIVKPGANLADIKMQIDHADEIKLVKGRLHINTSVNEIIEQRPYAYQMIDGHAVRVDVEFRLEESVVSFEILGQYDPSIDLIIDPELVFASYSGAVNDNWGTTATFDSQGNLYAGSISFGDYPTIFGAFQASFAGGDVDMAVSKFDPNGTTLIYSTYLGGTSSEVPHSLIVNSRDELVVLGSSGSTNFPASPGAYSGSFFGGTPLSPVPSSYLYSNGSDITVTVLSPDGSTIVGSTYFGGSGNDGIIDFVGLDLNYGDAHRGEVILDENDNIYIASITNSGDVDIVDGFDTQLNNGGIVNTSSDAIIASFNPDVTALRFSSYLGGEFNDFSTSLKLDENGDLFTVGFTASNDFPVAGGAINASSQGSDDGFVSKISGNGQNLLASGYLGSSGRDWSYFVEIDLNQNVYVLGQTSSGTYNITAGTYTDVGATTFIHSLSNDLTSTNFSTTVGSRDGFGSRIVPTALLVDKCERIYFSGWGGGVVGGNMTNLPITSDAFQSTTDGSDFYMMVLEPNATALEYGSYFGGGQAEEHVDGGTSRFDPEGIIYQAVCAGCRGFSDFPTTGGVVSQTNNATDNGRCNLGVFKFDFQLSNINIVARAEPVVTGCTPVDVSFQNFTTGTNDFEWDFDDGTISTQRSPTKTFVDTGTYNVRLIARSGQDCVPDDTTFLEIMVLPQLTDTTTSFRNCGALDTLLVSSQEGSNVDYIWSTGSTNRSILVSETGIYWVRSDGNNGCVQTDSFLVEIVTDIVEVNEFDLCEGKDTTLRPRILGGGATYLWQDNSTGNEFQIDAGGLYYVQIDQPGECTRWDTFRVNFLPAQPNPIRVEVCEGNTVTLESTASGIPDVEFVWDSGEMTDDLTVALEGSYVVTATADNFCTIIDSFIVNYSDTFHTKTFLGLCIAEDTILSSSNPIGGQTYIWQDGTVGPEFTINEGGIYWVYSEVNNCQYLDSFVVAQQEILFDIEKTNLGCELEPTGSISFVNTSGLEPLSYSIDGENFQESPDFFNLEGGTYRATVLDDIGCTRFMEVSIDTPVLADIAISPDVTISLSESTILTATVNVPLDQLDSLYWDIDSVDCAGDFAGCLIQEVMPVLDASYTITAVSVDGCLDAATVRVQVDFTRDIYIPNVFSPNQDGVNDLFYIHGKGDIVEQIHALRVFDRWGNLVFIGENFIPNDSRFGWDGTFRGQTMNPAVFTWTADIEYINGVREVTGGDVTLIR